jgi:hypothetical protein
MIESAEGFRGPPVLIGNAMQHVWTMVDFGRQTISPAAPARNAASSAAYELLVLKADGLDLLATRFRQFDRGHKVPVRGSRALSFESTATTCSGQLRCHQVHASTACLSHARNR